MGIEIIHHQGNAFCIGIAFLHQTVHTFGPFTCGVVVRHLNDMTAMGLLRWLKK